MFIGHYAVGLAAKKEIPKISLAVLFFAAQFPDMLWPFLVLFGVEDFTIQQGNTVVTPLKYTYYPFSHSFVYTIIWSMLFAGVCSLIYKNSRLSLWVGCVVFSHWVLDLIAHAPDLPLFPGGHVHIGLGLWNSLPGTLIVELFLFAIGIYLYLSKTRAKDKAGFWGFWAMVFILLAIYFLNIFGPPPPSVKAVNYSSFGLWIFVLFAWWVDKHRITV